MKISALLIIMLISAASCAAQNPYFENMKRFVWVGITYNEANIENTERLVVVKFTKPKDSLKTNSTLWTFDKDGRLNIHLYDAKLKKDSLVASYPCKFHSRKNMMTLTAKNGTSLVFDVAFFSSETIAKLTRRKD
jgi:hypothetical protein